MLFQQIASDAPGWSITKCSYSYCFITVTPQHMLAVVLSSPSAVNVSLGSTATFTCAAQQAHFLNWFINDSFNAERNPFNGVQQFLSQNSTVIVKELRLEATQLLNQSNVSCLASSFQAGSIQGVSSSRALLLVQGTDNTYNVCN